MLPRRLNVKLTTNDRGVRTTKSLAGKLYDSFSTVRTPSKNAFAGLVNTPNGPAALGYVYTLVVPRWHALTTNV